MCGRTEGESLNRSVECLGGDWWHKRLSSSVSLDSSGKIKVVLAGVDPAPVIIEGNQDTEADYFVKTALKKARSIDNEILTRTFRREMIKVYIKNSLLELGKNK